MGIASLILGIIGLLVSFSWFKDLSLIVSVVGLILGIIAIVKKKEKGMGIAGVVLTIIALVLCFTVDTTIDTNTGTGVTLDSGSGIKKVSVSTENITMEKVGITKYGDFVIKVTNNNEGAVCLSSITTIFKDSSGNFVISKEADQSFVCIPAKGVTYVHNWGYDENYSQYPTYEFKCEFGNISDYFVYNGIELKSNNTGKQIAVTLTNNSGKTIESANVTVVYYQGNEIVGITTGYSDTTVANGSNAYINVEYAKDSRYQEVSFDKYEVYYTQASVMF